MMKRHIFTLAVTVGSAFLNGFPVSAAEAQAPGRLIEAATALSQRSDGQGMLDYARLLRAGVPVDAQNPLLVSDFGKARTVLEAALTIPGPHQSEAKLTLAKMLFAGEGGSFDINRALSLLEEAGRAGVAEAAYIAGRTMVERQLSAADAKARLQLALRLGYGAAAFELAGLAGTPETEAQSMIRFGIVLLERRAASGDERAAYDLATYYRENATSDEVLRAALDWYRKAGELGHKRSVFWIARLQMDSATSLFNPAEAADYLNRAAEAGDIEAAQELVKDFTESGNINVNQATFDKWMRRLAGVKDAKAVLYFSVQLQNTSENRKKLSNDLFAQVMNGETRDVDALLRIGTMFRDGDGVIADARRALDIYGLTLARQSKDGTTLLAQLLLEKPELRTEESLTAARNALVATAAAGSINAIVLRGDFSLHGIGQTVDIDDAMAWYSKALAVRPSVRVLNRLAETALLSFDPKRKILAVGWLEKAEALGSDAAMLKLGKLYAEGQVVPVDIGKATEYLERSAARGRTDGLIELANLHMRVGGPDAFEKAHAIFQRAVDRGDVEASVEMARFLRANGRLEEALPLLETAARAGSFSAAIDLVDILSLEGGETGKAREFLEFAANIPELSSADRFLLAGALLKSTDPLLSLRGVNLAREMAGAGYPGAAAMLAATYLEEGKSERNFAEARRVLEEGIANSDVEATIMMADLLLDGVHTPADPSKALSYYDRALAVQPKNPSLNLKLARMYADGVGVGIDKKRAADYLRTASDAGSRSAQRELGLAYLWGAGVPQNRDLATENLQAAADAGFDRAWHDLAALESSGFAAPVDPEAAFAFNYKGAKRGDAAAMIDVGLSLLSGFGVPHDGEAGIGWLEKAAATRTEEGPLAMYRLYEAYRWGQGVERDVDKANEWLARAAAANNPSAMFQTALVLRADSSQALQAEGLVWLRRAQLLKHNQANKILMKMAAADPHFEIPKMEVVDENEEP
ncbi:tetratricopeptide repeat protein [Agrobacterium leguminum]|nr:sel1 repeat family protein [Agrobacterium leguminum]